MHFVYLVRCRDNSLYCGQTNDPEKRLKEHNMGAPKGAKYTKSRRPVKLVYLEECANLSDALKREWEIKRWTKKEKEALISRYNESYLEIGGK